jgi:hypothetical protein
MRNPFETSLYFCLWVDSMRKKNQSCQHACSNFISFITKAAYLYVHFAKIYLQELTCYHRKVIAMLVDPAHITIDNHRLVPLQRFAVRHNIPVHRSSSPASHIIKFQHHDRHQSFERQVRI